MGPALSRERLVSCRLLCRSLCFSEDPVEFDTHACGLTSTSSAVSGSMQAAFCAFVHAVCQICKMKSVPSLMVRQANSGNPLLELRSNAGTHDVEFGLKALADLKACRSPDHVAAIPRYNKAAHQGRGTRAEPSAWPHIHGPVDVILFEGWMLGFSPVCFVLSIAYMHGWTSIVFA